MFYGAAAFWLPPLFFSRNIDGNTPLLLDGLDEEIEIDLLPDPIGEEFFCGIEEGV